MSQAAIDARSQSFVGNSVVPAATELNRLINDLRAHRSFYLVNNYPAADTNPIVDADVDPFWFVALNFHQWHDLIVQIVNFADGNAVNGGVAFRYRNFYELLPDEGFVPTLPAPADANQGDKRTHVQEGIVLAQRWALAVAQANRLLGVHTTSLYGPGAANEITDLLLAAFRFGATDYNGYMNMAIQLDNFTEGDAPVVPGFYQDVLVRIVSADA